MFGVVDHAGQQRDEAGEVARPRRQIRQLTRGDVAADLRRREVDLRRLGGDGDALFETADPHQQIDLQRRADSHDHVVLREAAEALELGGDAIGPGHQARHQVRAVGTGDGFAHRAALLVRHDDRDARQDGLLGIGDASANRRSALLRGGRGGDEQSSDEQREHASHHEALRSLGPLCCGRVRYTPRVPRRVKRRATRCRPSCSRPSVYCPHACRALALQLTTVLVFTTTDCPISNRYAPEIQRLAKKFASGRSLRAGVSGALPIPTAMIRRASEEVRRTRSSGVRDTQQELVKLDRRHRHAGSGGDDGGSASAVSRPHRRSLHRLRQGSAAAHGARSRARARRRSSPASRCPSPKPARSAAFCLILIK